MTTTSPPPDSEKVNVRNMISIFERQTEIVNNEPSMLRRAKSMGSLNYTRRKPSPEPVVPQESNLELAQIEQQVQHLQKTLTNNYKSYSRDTHIYYQNQIIFVLADLANFDTKSNARAINKKSELSELLKRLNQKLNALLPGGTSLVKAKPIQSVESRARPAEEKPKKTREVKREKVETKREKPEPKREKAESRVEEPRREQEEVDAPPVSVRNLKELFERNSNQNEAKTEYGTSKLTRKFFTFHGSNDLKYVPYSQRFQSTAPELTVPELIVQNGSLKKQTSLDLDSEPKFVQNGSFKKQTSLDLDSEPKSVSFKAEESDDDQKVDDLSPDSLSPSGSSSSSGKTTRLPVSVLKVCLQSRTTSKARPMRTKRKGTIRWGEVR
jgi:hypothetical protein